jgi:leader peptidase (prepilin peptidase)/N-methyltransferase
VTTALVLLCALLGLLVGSFLNVVIYRVPRGESVVKPRSRCPGCGNEISPRDNIPVLSWLLLKGRCRHCGEPISIRYPAVELLTSLVFVSMALRFGLAWVLPAFLYLGAVGVALALIDLDVKRLPDALTLPSYVVGAVLLGGAAIADGDAGLMVRAALGAFALFAFYFLLLLIYPPGMGFGDVKLAGVLGLYLGYLGWGTLIVGGFLGFLLGAIVSIGLMLVRRAGRKSKIPFGPFMLVGAFLAIFIGQPLADAYLRTLGL